MLSDERHDLLDRICTAQTAHVSRRGHNQTVRAPRGGGLPREIEEIHLLKMTPISVKMISCEMIRNA